MEISILFGGASYEHEISIVSAISLLKKIKDRLVVSHCIFLDSNREFYLIDKDNMRSSYFSSSGYKSSQKLEVTHRGFIAKRLLGRSRFIDCGVVLNLVHGADGEDGKLSSIFDFFDIRFVGPRIEACAISFNKYLTKLYARDRGIPTLPFDVYGKRNIRDAIDSIVSGSLPFILKPARLGSSIGIKVVESLSDIEYALDCAFEFDDEIIVEPFIKGVREYNLAGCKIKSDYIFSSIEEPRKGDLLNFKDKYLDFSCTAGPRLAELDEPLKSKIEEAFIKVYDCKFEGSLVRCDFFLVDGDVYLNEINPIPGSMANYLFPDFEFVLERLATNLPSRYKIPVNYRYIHEIHQAKGDKHPS